VKQAETRERRDGSGRSLTVLGAEALEDFPMPASDWWMGFLVW